MKINKNEFLKYLLLGGLMISPFIYWLPAPIPFEIPRVFSINRWIEAMVVVGTFTNLYYLRKEKFDNKLLLLVAIFFTIAITSSFFGVNWEKSIMGNYYRADGLITLAHLTGYFFLVVLFFQTSWIKPLSISICLGSFAVSVWALYDAIKLYLLHIYSTPNWDGAIGVTFGNPNFLAGYLVVTLPFITYLASLYKKQRLKLFGILIVQIAAILLTKALGGILGILVFFILIAIFQKIKYRKIIMAIVLTLLLVMGFFISLDLKGQRYDQYFAAEGRERIIRKGLMAFKTYPFMGWGWANFDYAFDSVVWPVRLDHDVYVDKAHSLFLEILVTTGIIGFISYSATIFRSFTNLLKMKKFQNPLIYVLILFIVHSQTNIISIGEEIIFWTVLGISAKKFKNSYLPNLSTEKYS